MGKYCVEVLVLVSVLSIVLHNAWFCFGKNSTTKCIDKEREALLQLRQDLSDPKGSLSSWNGEDCCMWKGVICDGLNGHIVKLRLSPPQLFGKDNPDIELYKPTATSELNSSLLNLRYLNYLDLSGIHLTRVPEFFGSMKELKYLNLSGTQFEGQVPHQFGNLTKLEVLDISEAYSGDVAINIEWVSHLRSLKFLDMSSVNMSRAQHIIQVLSILPSLTHLSLSSCELSNLHLSSHRLANSTPFIHLLYLDLSVNHFTVPGTNTIFQNMTSLIYLDFSENSFQRIIERELFLLLKNKPYLKSLFL